MAVADHRVLLVSLEDSKELQAHRLLGRCSRLAYGDIHGNVLTPEERGRLCLPAEALEVATRVGVIDDIEPNIDDILALARSGVERGGLSCLAIDYIQLLDGRGDERMVLKDALTKCSRFALRMNISVVLISQQQQGREREHDDPRPRIGDLFGGSSMRMQSKLIVGLFRPWKYNKKPSSSGPFGCYGKLISANPDHGDLYERLLEVHIIKNSIGVEKPLFALIDPAVGTVESADALMAPYL